jgi:hypothetical protein
MDTPFLLFRGTLKISPFGAAIQASEDSEAQGKPHNSHTFDITRIFLSHNAKTERKGIFSS